MAAEELPYEATKYIYLLDLHEDIFREIFRHLKFSEVYFTLRNVCRKIKYYVDEYIQLGGMFMVTGSRRIKYHEMLFVFKQNNNVVSICSKPAMPFPSYSSLLGSFGGTFKGKIVVGICVDGSNAVETIYRKGRGEQNNITPFRLNEYDIKENKWIPIQPSNLYVNPYQGFGVIKSSNQIGNSSIIIVHEGDSMVVLRLLHLNVPDTEKTIDRPTFSSHFIYFPPELKMISNFTLIRVENNKIMLVGGMDSLQPIKCLWEGTLTDNEKDLIWKVLEVKSIKMRILLFSDPNSLK